MKKNIEEAEKEFHPTKWETEILNRKGAPEQQHAIELQIEDLRKKDPLEAVITVASFAYLESSKKQVRRSWEQFEDFLRKRCSAEVLAAPMEMKVLVWVQDYLNTHPAVTRVTTLWQKVRLLQAMLPKFNILRSPMVKAYFRGLGRLQQTVKRDLPAASFDQCTRLMGLAKSDPWSMTTAMLMIRGAARWSDIRMWLGGKGILLWQEKTKTMALHLNYRKTDQAGTAPRNHIVGPIRLNEEEKTLLRKEKALWKKNPLQPSPFANPNDFMKRFQNKKRAAGIKNFIELRRARARKAAERLPTEWVGSLLGHKPHSVTTYRYTQSLDAVEFARRVEMTE